MAVGVVHLFETIQVDNKDGKPAGPPMGDSKALRQAIGQQSAVWQPREWIVQRLKDELLLSLPSLLCVRHPTFGHRDPCGEMLWFRRHEIVGILRDRKEQVSGKFAPDDENDYVGTALDAPNLVTEFESLSVLPSDYDKRLTPCLPFGERRWEFTVGAHLVPAEEKRARNHGAHTGIHLTNEGSHWPITLGTSCAIGREPLSIS